MIEKEKAPGVLEYRLARGFGNGIGDGVFA